jgi:CheY-like chemotaxis protein
MSVSAAPRQNDETVLVTDDESMVLDLVRTLLQAQGYKVLLAADGPEAIRISKEHPGAIDLLLTDMVMPGMSGPELAKELMARRPLMKVLYMSGYTEYAVVNQGVMERVQSFIWKPFSNAALAQKVREVLDSPPAK